MAKKTKKKAKKKAKKKSKKATKSSGRPTDYAPIYCQQIIDYFKVEPYREVTKKIITKKGDVITTTEEVANDLPTLAGFAITIGKHRATIHTWTEVHTEFHDAYKLAKEYQENFLVVNGNKGLINASFGIFTAKNILKWRDRQPDEGPDVVINNYQDMTDQELDARIKELEKKVRKK